MGLPDRRAAIVSIHTRCPICHTVFRLDARDLSDSLGQAKCGVCGMVFDAIAHHLPEFSTQDDTAETTEPSPSSADLPLDLMLLEPPVFPDITTATMPVEYVLPEQEPALANEPITAALNSADVAISSDKAAAPSIQFKAATKPHQGKWIAINTLLFMLILVQYGVFRQTDILGQSPILYRAWQTWLTWTGEPDLPPNNLSALKITESELRAAPDNSYLLLSMSITNMAATPVAYPNIAISLKQENGDVVSSKNLSPKEYLPVQHQTALTQELPSQQSTTILLKLNSTTSNVSDYSVKLYYPEHPN
jgi:predicted Zn finger-like uncharacterized protein